MTKKLFTLLTALVLCSSMSMWGSKKVTYLSDADFITDVYSYIGKTSTKSYPIYCYQWSDELMLYMTFKSSLAGSWTYKGNTYVMPAKGSYTVQSSSNAERVVGNYQSGWSGDTKSIIKDDYGDFCNLWNGTITIEEGADGPYIYSSNLTEYYYDPCYDYNYYGYCIGQEFELGYFEVYIGSPATYRTVSVVSNNTTMGTVSYTYKSGYVYANNRSKEFKEGSFYTLTATKKDGYRFENWTRKSDGKEMSRDESFDVEIEGNETYTANFVPQTSTKYIITTGVNDANMGSVTPATGEQYENANITLTATPKNDNYYFVKWQIDGVDDTSADKKKAIRTITVTAAKRYTAVFAERQVVNINAGTMTLVANTASYIEVSGTGKDANTNTYSLALRLASPTSGTAWNVVAANTTIQQQDHSAVTSEGGSAELTKLNTVWYDVNVIVLAGDHKYVIQGYFDIPIVPTWKHFELSHITSNRIRYTNDGAGYAEEGCTFNPDQQVIELIFWHKCNPQQKNYLELYIHASYLDYNGIIAPAPGDYDIIEPKHYDYGYESGSGSYFYMPSNTPSEFVIGHGNGYYGSSIVSTHFSDRLDWREENTKQFNGGKLHVEVGKSGNLFLYVAKADGTICVTAGEPADCPIKQDFSATCTNINMTIDKNAGTATLNALTDGKTAGAHFEFYNLTNFDDVIGIPAGTYTIGTNVKVGVVNPLSGSYTVDDTYIWNLASGAITIVNNGDGTISINTTNLTSLDNKNVSVSATSVIPTIYKNISLSVPQALYNGNNWGRFRFMGTATSGENISSICFSGDEANAVGTYTTDDLYENAEIDNVEYSQASGAITKTADGYFYLLNSTIQNPIGNIYNVQMKAIVPIRTNDYTDDYQEDFYEERNTTKAVKFTMSNVTISQVSDGKVRLHAKTGGSNYLEANLYFYTGLNSAEIPSGTYIVDETGAVGTVAMIESNAYRSYDAHNWKLCRGTVEVVNLGNGNYYVSVQGYNSWYNSSTGGRNYYVNYTIGSAPVSSNITLKLADENGSATMGLTGSSTTYSATTTGVTQSFYDGQELTLTATHNDGYRFKQWQEDGNTNATRTVIVNGAATYTAEFEEEIATYTLTMDACKNGTYSVAFGEEEPEYTGNGDKKFEVAYGTSVTLSAEPATGYEFLGWSVQEDWSAPHRATMEGIGGGAGIGGDIEAGSGDYASKKNPYTFTMTEDVEYQAVFGALKYDITIAACEYGTIKVERTTDNGKAEMYNGAEGTTLTVAAGTELTLTATADEANHYEFKYWELVEDFIPDAPRRATTEGPGSFVPTELEDGLYTNPYTFTVSEAVEYAAVFGLEQITVSVTTANPTMGSVMVLDEDEENVIEPTKIEGNTKQYVLDYGTFVYVKAVANTGYYFTNWDDEETENPYELDVEEDIDLTASFTANFQLVGDKPANDVWYTDTYAPMKGKSISVTYVRTFLKDHWTSFSLPFNYSYMKDENQTFRGVVYELDNAVYDDGYLQLNFLRQTASIVANKPYVVHPSEEIVNPIFENVKLLDIADASYNVPCNSGHDVTYKNTLHKTTLDKSKNIIYLNQNKLYYPNQAKDTNMPAFRGYFNLNLQPEEIKHAPKIRIVVEGEEVMNLEDEAAEEFIKKYFDNEGNLIIENNGVKYDAKGQQL